MEPTQDPPGRALPAGASPGLSPGSGPNIASDPEPAAGPPLDPAAVHRDELRALIDDVVLIDLAMAALALARTAAIDVGVDLVRAVAIDAARVRSERTPPENRRARRARARARARGQGHQQ